MPNFTEFELPDLMDLLVRYTDEYRAMQRDSSCSIAEFTRCKLLLLQIQQAVKGKIEDGGFLLKNRLPDFPDYITDDMLDILPPNKEQEKSDL